MAGKGYPAPSGTGRKLLSTVPLYFYFSLDSGFFFRHTSLVNDALLVQGRQVTESNLQEIRELLAAHPAWSRRRLSEALCEQWNWCNGAGLRKDMAARTLLLKLHQRGLIALPARRQLPTNRMRPRVPAPWVRIAHLGSYILGSVLRRLSADWQNKYGHPIALVETFVERDRFRGTVYQAANWQRVGETQGRTRQDRYHALQVPIKEIYVYPLQKHFRKVLVDEPA